MALKGTMLLNGADYAPFNLYGVGGSNSPR